MEAPKSNSFNLTLTCSDFDSGLEKKRDDEKVKEVFGPSGGGWNGIFLVSLNLNTSVLYCTV